MKGTIINYPFPLSDDRIIWTPFSKAHFGRVF